jgi:hypothetical protein
MALCLTTSKQQTKHSFVLIYFFQKKYSVFYLFYFIIDSLLAFIGLSAMKLKELYQNLKGWDQKQPKLAIKHFAHFENKLK